LTWNNSETDLFSGLGDLAHSAYSLLGLTWPEPFKQLNSSLFENGSRKSIKDITQ